MSRYTVFKGSKSAHCCFEGTVVDTTKPEIIGGDHFKSSDGQLHYETICECFSVEDAELVCKALNALMPKSTQDTEALNWIERQHLEELGMGLVIDAPKDGQYYVCGDSGTTHYGKTLRDEALANAMAEGA